MDFVTGRKGSGNPNIATFLIPGFNGAKLSLLRFARAIETLLHVEILARLFIKRLC
jgi:hypothetical protein